MRKDKIDASLALHRHGRLLIARDRISLLEAVAEHGSITRAAQVLGFSYKAGWDAVNAINNLLPRPAVLSRTGGKAGGGAEVTAEGRRLIVAFRHLEEHLGRISAAIAEAGLESDQDLLFWGVGVRTSARNALYCQVVSVKRDSVDVEVGLQISDKTLITAVVTNGAIDDLGIAPGRPAVALIKSSFVMLARADDMPRISARNRIPGTVIARTDSGINAEITLTIGEGKTFTSVITGSGAEELDLKVGDEACALFKSSHVILAVE
jgi:molybdate transport system regulatory protein